MKSSEKNKQPVLIVIGGPTGIGKTALAIKIAQHFKTEILSADSRQFYREMKIGTARPMPEQLKMVKHHFVGCYSVEEEINAGKFERLALDLLHKLFAKHDVLILAGGSGLFIRAVCEGFDDLPDADRAIRDRLWKDYDQHGIAVLQRQLKKLDPEHYRQMDVSNPQRLMRALEVCLITGKPYSAFLGHRSGKRFFKTIKIALDMEREELHDRINRRVDEMIAEGLEEEVKSLLGYQHLNALQSVGYVEMFDYLNGNISLDRAIELIKRNTRRFARRQLTWFRKDKEFHWFHPGDSDNIIAFIEKNIED